MKASRHAGNCCLQDNIVVKSFLKKLQCLFYVHRLSLVLVNTNMYYLLNDQMQDLWIETLRIHTLIFFIIYQKRQEN